MDVDAVDGLIRRTRLERGLPARIEDPRFYMAVAHTLAGDEEVVADVRPLPRVDRGEDHDDDDDDGPALSTTPVAEDQARRHLRVVDDAVLEAVRAAMTAANAATLGRLIEQGYDPVTGRWAREEPPEAE